MERKLSLTPEQGLVLGGDAGTKGPFIKSSLAEPRLVSRTLWTSCQLRRPPAGPLVTQNLGDPLFCSVSLPGSSRAMPAGGRVRLCCSACPACRSPCAWLGCAPKDALWPQHPVWVEGPQGPQESTSISGGQGIGVIKALPTAGMVPWAGQRCGQGRFDSSFLAALPCSPKRMGLCSPC